MIKPSSNDQFNRNRSCHGLTPFFLNLCVDRIWYIPKLSFNNLFNHKNQSQHTHSMEPVSSLQSSGNTFFTPDLVLAVYIINGIASGLSVIGGFYMITIYLTDIIMRNFPMKLVMAQVVIGLLYTCANIMIYFSGTPICWIQGFFRTTFELSSVFWALFMTFITFDHVKTFKSRFEDKFWTVLFCIIGISATPPIVAIISSAKNGFFQIKVSGLVCGLYPEPFDLFIVYVPMMICISLIAIFSIKTRSKLKKLMEGNSDNDFGMIFWYPIILAILWMPNMIQSILTIFNLSDNYPVFFTHFILSRMLGFVNALVYGKFYRQQKAKDMASRRNYRNISMTESKTSSSEFAFRFNSVA